MQKPLIVAGCYERFLFTYAPPSESESGEAAQGPAELERRDTFAAHKHAVKCVAGVGQFLASGGADDTIHLYDVKRHKDLGFLMNPGEGAVPCLKFFTPKAGAPPTHLFSGSADGSICIWKAGGDWEHLKTMVGHKAAVNDLAIHKSGRLALSVSRDNHIRIWNLLKGQCSYKAPLELEGEAVEFLPSGLSYALVCGSLVTIHDTSGEGGVRAKLTHARRVQCMVQQSDDVLLTGAEDGAVRVWDLRTNSCVQTMERMHTSRVRGLAVLQAGTGSIPELFTSASSDGVIKVWDSRKMTGAGLPTCLASSESRARITCLCVVHPATEKPLKISTSKPKPQKTKQKEGGEEQGQEGRQVQGQTAKRQAREEEEEEEATQQPQQQRGAKQQHKQQRKGKGAPSGGVVQSAKFKAGKGKGGLAATKPGKPLAPKPVIAKGKKGQAPGGGGARTGGNGGAKTAVGNGKLKAAFQKKARKQK